MPVPQQLGRGDRMGRGPYEKSGLLEDTSLPPHRRVEERFEIPFPTKDVDATRQPLFRDMEVEVKLWYLPFGTMNTSPVLWRQFTTTVHLGEGGK